MRPGVTEEERGGRHAPSNPAACPAGSPVSCPHHQCAYRRSLKTRMMSWYSDETCLSQQPPQRLRGVREPPPSVPHPTLWAPKQFMLQKQEKRAKRTWPPLNPTKDQRCRAGMSSIAHQTGTLPSHIIIIPVSLLLLSQHLGFPRAGLCCMSSGSPLCQLTHSRPHGERGEKPSRLTGFGKEGAWASQGWRQKGRAPGSRGTCPETQHLDQ